MTKAELKSAIDKAGGVKEHRTKEWDEAFKEYNATHPNDQRRRGSCGPCYRKVYEWLSQ